MCKTYRLAPTVEQSSAIAWFQCSNHGSVHFYTWSASMPIQPVLVGYEPIRSTVIVAACSIVVLRRGNALTSANLTTTAVVVYIVLRLSLERQSKNNAEQGEGGKVLS